MFTGYMCWHIYHVRKRRYPVFKIALVLCTRYQYIVLGYFRIFVVQRQTAVTVYYSSEQLLMFAIVRQYISLHLNNSQ